MTKKKDKENDYAEDLMDRGRKVKYHNINTDGKDPKLFDRLKDGMEEMIDKTKEEVFEITEKKDLSKFVDFPVKITTDLTILPENDFVYGKKILVTGGTGFLGKHIVKSLKDKGAIVDNNPHRYDLTSHEQTRSLIKNCKADYIIHCAGYNGGIEFNRKYPAQILHNNLLMGLNVHHLAAEFDCKKIVSIISSCAHPDVGNTILKEDELWDGPCNATIEAHGVAKRCLQTAAKAYHSQYGLDAITVCVTNMMGPGDTFNLERTKVVGALIRKVVEAHQHDLPEIECWGTGKPLREFMYAPDAAEAIIQALEKYDNHAMPLNIGTNHEVSIKELVEKIIGIVGYKGKVKWNTDKPDGQMKKLLDTSNMDKLLDVEITDFDVALQQTIEWYIENKDMADKRK